MKILLINGPPRSGKDTVAKIIKQAGASLVHLEKFAQPIKTCVPLAYSIPLDQWEKDLDTPNNKDLSHDLLYGETPRDVQISFSEDWLKLLNGEDIFGKLLLRRIERLNSQWFQCVVISDSGFREEAKVLVEYYGAVNCRLWRMQREEHNFRGDSRGYIDLDELGVRTWDIPNNGSLNDLRDLVLPLYDAMNLSRNEMTEETYYEWDTRLKEAEAKAFRDWPNRKIARIKKESDNAEDNPVQADNTSKDNDNRGSSG